MGWGMENIFSWKLLKLQPGRGGVGRPLVNVWPFGAVTFLARQIQRLHQCRVRPRLFGNAGNIMSPRRVNLGEDTIAFYTQQLHRLHSLKKTCNPIRVGAGTFQLRGRFWMGSLGTIGGALTVCMTIMSPERIPWSALKWAPLDSLGKCNPPMYSSP